MPTRKLVLRISLVLLLLASLCAALIAYAGTVVFARVGTKSAASHSPSRPSEPLGHADPILQFESHTCGLLALSAAYEVHALSPQSENLRYRLGVDRVADPTDQDSTGTLHPDLFRVLVQDHFAYRILDPRNEFDRGSFIGHLEEGGVSILLIARRENGNLHWVLADEVHDRQLRVVDSLFEYPYREPIDDFMTNHVLSVVCITPAAAGARISEMQAHADGLMEMDRVRRRLSKP
ncbi:MAG: hypothetical protein AAGB34_09200 [Planctomycetota bacterium]